VDSTGLALYGDLPSDRLVLRTHLEASDEVEAEARHGRLRDRLSSVASVEESELVGSLVRTVVSGVQSRDDLEYLGRVTETVEAADGLELFSIGTGMEIIKDIGPAEQLEKHSVSGFDGGHGIAHTRLATESKVDIGHSHPFWARPFPDIAVVHNGQLTNHNTLRRRFEKKGYTFLTKNDSEVIAVYVADRLLKGASMQEALSDSVRELDGTFTYLVSTADGIGFAKDRFATKPLVVAETDDMVAMASEEIALDPVITEDSTVYEPTAKAVKTWLR
jgi:glutamate synthase domain-containing protein 1